MASLIAKRKKHKLYYYVADAEEFPVALDRIRRLLARHTIPPRDGDPGFRQGHHGAGGAQTAGGGDGAPGQSPHHGGDRSRDSPLARGPLPRGVGPLSGFGRARRKALGVSG